MNLNAIANTVAHSANNAIERKSDNLYLFFIVSEL